MKSNFRTISFLHRHLRSTLLLACILLLPALSYGQELFVKNAFVGAGVYDGTGWLTIYNGDPKNGNGDRLTYKTFSSLAVQVNGQFFSNNNQLTNGGNNLTNGRTTRIGDTLQTIWPETGFDIVQRAYPVAFTTSGVIVLSVKIVNHTQLRFDAQAQFLLDNENGTNDQAYLLHRYGYFRTWQDCPPSPMPSFCLSFENPPDAPDLGVTGIGYFNDSFPPRPLGLMQPSRIEFGNWTDQSLVPWGPTPGFANRTLQDDATLMIGKLYTANAFDGSGNDSVTEIFRTAYGTPEWCFAHGNLVAFALYPQHLFFDSKTNRYTPNPIQIQAFIFNVKQSTANNVKVTQTIGSPVKIKTTNPIDLGTIGIGGFKELHWTDSTLVLQGGCAKSYAIDIQFDVTSSNLPDPIFTNPWKCQIEVECPHPDTIPPLYQNSYVGCNTQRYDTTTIQEADLFDLGLHDISFSSPDLNSADYSVAFGLPAQPCSKTPIKVYVQQIDTFKAGRVILKSTDCAGNISLDTICFTAHAALPDKNAPAFVLNTAGADCHTRCTDWTITDTLANITSIDRGIDKIAIVSSNNMTVTGLPPGGTFPPSARTTTFNVCATDTMLDGKVILSAIDTAHNISYDTISFCTTPDTHAPIITQGPFDPVSNTYPVHVTDTQAWDRGLATVTVDQTGNTSTIPTPLVVSNCPHIYDFQLHVDDPTKCGRGTIHASDCSANSATPYPINYSKSSKPTITASKLLLCSATDSVVLTANGSFATYSWSNGSSSQKIVVRSAGSYTVNADDGVGCTATSDPLTITLSPAISNITPAGPLVTCAPDSFQLDAGADFATYQWLKDGVAMNSETSQKLWAHTSGTYSANVTNAAGCAGTSQPVSVTINPLPAKPVITSAANLLTSTSAASYQWSLDGTPIPGATSQTFTPQTGGDFTVTVKDANGCSSTSLPYSNAGSTVIAVPSIVKAQQSQAVTIPLSIVTSASLPLGIDRKWHAALRFNKTLLVPDNGSFASKNVQGSDLVVQYSGTTGVTNGVISNLPFTAALGNDSCTSVTIDTFWWETPGITVTRRNGDFCLTGLCYQGGTRLFNPEGKFTLSVARPNPAQNNLQIDYELIEYGHTMLVVSDMLGREVLRLVDADQEPGVYSVGADIEALPAGTYIYSLRTPTLVKSHQLQIAR